MSDRHTVDPAHVNAFEKPTHSIDAEASTKAGADASGIRRVVNEMEAFLQIAPAAEEQAVNSSSISLQMPGYEIGAELGRGGMGIVYWARDLEFGREVAVKFLRETHATNASAVRRFTYEARITGQLQHPGIPAAYRVGTLCNGRPYLAMKLIRGHTLDKLRAESAGAGSPNLIAIFEAICQAVGYAHAQGVIHRDLKPANVMVGSFGEVQVMDWGLAKLVNSSHGDRSSKDEQSRSLLNVSAIEESSHTQEGSILGTLAYMPPEQATGDINRIDQRSDVFALGGILCFILTGKAPYSAGDLASYRFLAAECRIEEAFARLDQSGALPELIALAKQCLAFDPVDRPANASVLATTVAELRADSERRARDAEMARARLEVEAAEQRKRRRIQLALTGSVVAILALAGVGLWWSERQSAEQARKDAEHATERRLADEYNQKALVAALDQAEAGLRKDNPIHGEIDAALVQAEFRLPADKEAEVGARFEELRRARRMLDRLDEIDRRRWTVEEGKHHADDTYAKSHYPSALKDYGIFPNSQPTEVSAEKVRSSPIEARLLIALDAWLTVGAPAEVLELINQLDGDSVRVALRTAYFRKDVTTINEKLSGMDGRTLSPVFAQFIGNHRLTPQSYAINLLTQAQARHPSSFGVAVVAANRHPSENVQERIKFYRIALAIRPDNNFCHHNLAVALLDAKDFDGAIVASNEAIRLNPKNALAHFNIGVALKGQNQLDKACESFRKAIQLDSQYAQAHFRLGTTLIVLKDFSGAEAAFRDSLRIDSKDATTHHNLGVALASRGKLDEAITSFQAAIRIDPKYSEAFHNLGFALQKKNVLDEAIAAYKEAIRLNPNNHGAHQKLGLLLAGKMDVDSAIKALREAVRLNPADGQAQVNLGVALASRKDTTSAIAAFREAIRIDPKDASAHYNLGVALKDQNDIRGAIAAFRESIRHDKDDISANYNLGLLLNNTQEHQSAITSFRTVIRLEPNHARAHNHLGVALAATNDHEGAIAAYRKAIKIDVKYAAAYHNLGVALQNRQDLDGAIVAFQEAARLKYPAVTTYGYLGAILALKGKPLAALNVLKEAARMNPAWLNSPESPVRIYSIRYAAIAGTGNGIDAPPEADRFAIRKEAYDWLLADLASWRRQSLTVTGAQKAQKVMDLWLSDSAFTGVRDAELLKKLQEKERRAWEPLWADVRKLYEETRHARELLPLPKTER